MFKKIMPVTAVFLAVTGASMAGCDPGILPLDGDLMQAISLEGQSVKDSLRADGNSNPGVLPIGFKHFGKSYGEWAAEWWKWITAIPFDENPMFDETGEFCDIGQSGKVFFLASTFGFGEWVRECEVPANKVLFFPIVPAVFWAPEDGETEEEVRAGANEAMDGVNLLKCTVDGVRLEDLFDQRAESPAFTLPDTLLIDFGFDPGDRFPAVADGYWIMLAPLSRGEHVIHFRMRIARGPFAGSNHDVTYLLTVE